MIWLLRIIFGGILVTMLCATSWASLQCPLWKTPQALVTHPWFIATLFDCYFGFLTFYAWVFYKETAWLARVGWLIAILLLGNIAMSTYMLITLFRLPAAAGMEQVLLRKKRINPPAINRSSLAMRCQQFWRERVVGLLVAQLKQGIFPEKIALTIALGICLAAFPIVGATSLLCLVFGVWLGLNQPIIQLVNWLASPLQLGMLPVFVRLGEWVTRAQRVSFSIPEMFAKFRQSPTAFFKEFGLTGWHGIVGWSVTIPFAGVLLYVTLLPLTKRLRQLHVE